MKPTNPIVGGTVDNHKKPKVIPNKIAIIGLGGKNIKIPITILLLSILSLESTFY